MSTATRGWASWNFAKVFNRLLSVLLTLSFVGCSDKRADSTATVAPSARIDALDSNAVSILRQLPHVANVTRHGPAEQPTHRVIHVCNWHLVSLDDYLADLQSQTDEPLTKDEMDRYQAQLVGRCRCCKCNKSNFSQN